MADLTTSGLAEELIQAYDATRPLARKAFRSACYAPFTTLGFSINGEVLACWKSARHVLGRIGERLPLPNDAQGWLLPCGLWV